jgi:hypothetical protein
LHCFFFQLAAVQQANGIVRQVGNKGNTMTTKIFTAIVHKEKDMYVAECPEVGTVAQGETI